MSGTSGAAFRETLMAAIDDMAAAVDALAQQFTSIERRLDAIEHNTADDYDRIVTTLGQLDEMIRETSEAVTQMSPASEEGIAAEVVSRLEEAGFLADARDLIEALDRKERLEMLADARSSKGRMALIQFK